MAEITFKATRRKHDSGYAEMEKGGDLEYDLDRHSSDVIILYTQHDERITIDCDFKTKVFSVRFSDRHFKPRNG